MKGWFITAPYYRKRPPLTIKSSATRHAPRATRHAPRHAPRATRHATRHAPRHAPRATLPPCARCAPVFRCCHVRGGTSPRWWSLDTAVAAPHHAGGVWTRPCQHLTTLARSGHDRVRTKKPPTLGTKDARHMPGICLVPPSATKILRDAHVSRAASLAHGTAGAQAQKAALKTPFLARRDFQMHSKRRF